MYDKDIDKWDGRTVLKKGDFPLTKQKGSKKGITSGKLLIIFIVIAAVALAGILTAWFLVEKDKREKAEEAARQHAIAVSEAVSVDTYYEGVSVEGVALGGKTPEEAKALVEEVLPGLRDKVDISVQCPSKTHELTEDDFTYTYNTDEVLEEAYQLGRTGTDEERYQKIQDLKQNPVDLKVTCELDISSSKAVVEKIAEETDVAAQEPKVSSFMPQKDIKFVMADGKNGLKLDEEDLQTKLDELLKGDKTGTIQAVTTTVPFKQTISEVEKQVRLLSTYSTTSTNNANANHNMALALSAANGTMLEPGEIFSFNETTGNTTNDSLGYRKANAISGGKMIEAYGGGICQASTTIYGAVLRADLKIVSRSNHSWPSTYVPIGQDASVNYPDTDFKFQNNTDHQIFISAYMQGTKLTVEIYGTPPENADYDEIRVTSWKTESIQPGETQYVNDNTLPKGKQEVERQSRVGSRAVAYKVYYKNGKEVRREQIASSYYRPITGLVRVGTK